MPGRAGEEGSTHYMTVPHYTAAPKEAGPPDLLHTYIWLLCSADHFQTGWCLCLCDHPFVLLFVQDGENVSSTEAVAAALAAAAAVVAATLVAAVSVVILPRPATRRRRERLFLTRYSFRIAAITSMLCTGAREGWTRRCSASGSFGLEVGVGYASYTPAMYGLRTLHSLNCTHRSSHGSNYPSKDSL